MESIEETPIEEVPELQLTHPIIEAIRFGNPQNLIAALASHPEWIDVPDWMNRTPLLHACRKNSQSVKMLLEAGSQSILTPDQNGSLPLHFACQNALVTAVKSLLECTPVPNGKSKEEAIKDHALTLNIWNRTPLWYASVSAKDSATMEILLKIAPEAIKIIPKEVDAPDPDTGVILSENGSPILIDIIRQGAYCMDYLVRRIEKKFGRDWIIDMVNAYPPSERRSFLFHAIQAQAFALIEILLQMDPTEVDAILYGERVENNASMSPPILELILKIGERRFGLEWLAKTLVQSNKVENSVIHTIFYRGSALFQQAIIDHLDRIDKRGFPSSMIDPIRTCIQSSNARGQNLLYYIDNISSCEFLPSLIRWMTPNHFYHLLNSVDDTGYSPLHTHIRYRRKNHCRFLLWLGAELIDVVTNTKRIQILDVPEVSIFAPTKAIVRFLRCVGCIYDPNLQRERIPALSPSDRKAMLKPISEEKMLKERFRTYFRHSLTKKLLYFSG